MKDILTITLFLIVTAVIAQPKAELAPAGFSTVTVTIPSTPNEKLIELTKNWALESNKREGYDLSDVTANTITISGLKKNAFFYRNKGEGYDHDIRYDMKLNFSQSSYTVTFVVKEIYADNVRIEYNIPDYFTANGNLKEGYDDVKPSMEATVNNMIKSHYNFILNFR